MENLAILFQTPRHGTFSRLQDLSVEKVGEKEVERSKEAIICGIDTNKDGRKFGIDANKDVCVCVFILFF